MKSNTDRKSNEEQVDPDEYCVILNKKDSACITILKIVAMVVLCPVWIPLVVLKLLWELIKLTGAGIKESHKKKRLRRFLKWVSKVWIIPFCKGFGHTFKGVYLLIAELVVRPIIWIFAKILIPATTFWLDHLGKGIVYTLIGLYKVSLFVFMILAFISVHFAIGIKYTSLTIGRFSYFILVNFCLGLGHTCLTIGRAVRFLSVEFGKGLFHSILSIVRIIEMNASGIYHTLRSSWIILSFIAAENAKGLYHTSLSLWKGSMFYTI